jgi:hypothetical protein
METRPIYLRGYSQWRRFEDAVQRAITSCRQSGNEPNYHFVGAGKPITGGKGAINQRKGIAKKENLMDRMDATELAANQFRMTQTRDKLAREGVNSQPQAIRTHEEVGREVREAIRRIGGTMPENIPPAEHISEVEKRIKSLQTIR